VGEDECEADEVAVRVMESVGVDETEGSGVSLGVLDVE